MLTDYESGAFSQSTDFYYSDAWQVLEEHRETSASSSSSSSSSGATAPYKQYVWGIRYVDDYVLQDRDSSGDGTLDERSYGLQDANWNVVAMADDNSSVIERYAYEAYGSVLYLNATATPPVNQTSKVDQTYLFTGRRIDIANKFYQFRNRYFHSLLGIFITRDGAGYNDGLHLYQAYFAPNHLDPFGNQVSRNWDVESSRGARGSRNRNPATRTNTAQSSHAFISRNLTLAWVQKFAVRGNLAVSLQNGGSYYVSWEEEYVEAWGARKQGINVGGRSTGTWNKILDFHIARPTRSALYLEARGGFTFESRPVNQLFVVFPDGSDECVSEWEWTQQADFVLYHGQYTPPLALKSKQAHTLKPFRIALLSMNRTRDDTFGQIGGLVQNPTPAAGVFDRALKPAIAENNSLATFPPPLQAAGGPLFSSDTWSVNWKGDGEQNVPNVTYQMGSYGERAQVAPSQGAKPPGSAVPAM